MNEELPVDNKHDTENGNGHTRRREEWGVAEFVPLPSPKPTVWGRLMSTRPATAIREYAQIDKRPVPAWVPTAIIGLAMLLLTNIGLHIYWRGDTDRFIRDNETTRVDIVKLQIQMAEASKAAADLAAIKNWMIAVYERADANGWKLPPTPKEVR
jgi:hypothetical protein